MFVYYVDIKNQIINITHPITFNTCTFRSVIVPFAVSGEYWIHLRDSTTTQTNFEVNFNGSCAVYAMVIGY